MATSIIKFEHPTSINFGGITATDETDFLKQVVDLVVNCPVHVPSVFRAKYNGHFEMYGFYNNADTSQWFTASAGNRMYSVLKDGTNYSYYKQNFTALT